MYSGRFGEVADLVAAREACRYNGRSRLRVADGRHEPALGDLLRYFEVVVAERARHAAAACVGVDYRSSQAVEERFGNGTETHRFLVAVGVVQDGGRVLLELQM